VRGLIGAAFLLLAFAGIATAVAGGHLEGFDRDLMLALRTGDAHEPIGPKWVETFFLDITGLGSNAIIILIALAATGFVLIERKRGLALLMLAAVGGGMILNNLLKFAFDRARPDLVAHTVEVSTTSFPSGHAMLSAIAYLTLGALLARTQNRGAARIFILALGIAMTAVVGVSRVYLGVHWPSDVIAGWCAGGAWALICWETARALQKRGDVEPGN
jgi:undecaprenyl-diphosphatase